MKNDPVIRQPFATQCFQSLDLVHTPSAENGERKAPFTAYDRSDAIWVLLAGICIHGLSKPPYGARVGQN